MLAAMGLAVAMEPRNLMARTHDVFNIDQHLPTHFGDWKASRTERRRAAADGFARSDAYNQEASRGVMDPDGHVVMLMVAYGEVRATVCSCTIRSCYNRRGSAVANQREQA